LFPLFANRGPSLPRNASELRGDIVAGLSVTVIAIPQAIAYAIVAGVPPEYGIYSIVIQSLLAGLFSANHLMVHGPVNTQSLFVASVLSHLMRDSAMSEGEQGLLFVQLAIGLTLLKGIFQTAFALARLGAIARYFSMSVIVGFTAGAGILIGVGQLPAFLGIDEPVTNSLPGLWGTSWHIISNIQEAGWRAPLVGTVALAVIIGVGHISRLLPGPLIAVVVASTFTLMLGWKEQVHFVEVEGTGLPAIGLPNLTLRQFEGLLGGAFALSVLGLVETYSVSKAVAGNSSATVDANQELLGQGLIHVISSFFACIPGSGSLSRSALNVYAGAASRLAGVISGVVIAVVFLTAGHLAELIPLPALAALLFVLAYSLVDMRMIRRMWRSDRLDGVVCLFTLLATVSVPLHYAIFGGVLLNLALYIRRTSHLQLVRMAADDNGGFEEHRVNSPIHEQVVFLQLEGDLFFGMADELQQQLRNNISADVRVVLFRLKRTLSVDTSVLRVLGQFVSKMKRRGGGVVLCGLRPEIHAKMRSYGLIEQIGDDNVFPTAEGVFSSARKALRRASDIAEAMPSDQE